MSSQDGPPRRREGLERRVQDPGTAARALGLAVRPAGDLLRRVGRLEEAHAELATAVSMLREMGMAHWLPEAEAEIERLTVA